MLARMRAALLWRACSLLPSFLSEAMAQTAEAMSGRSVCLIGAGIMGITTAYYLAKSGRCSDIVLLEEGEPAGGASGKAAGFLARDWHGAPTAVSGHGESPPAGQTSSTSPSLQSLGKLSYELHSRLADELDGAQRYGYRKVPSLSMLVRRGQGDRSSSQADPLTAWTDGCNVSNVDVIDREGTAQLHPEQFCHALLEECQRAGVRLVRGRAEKVVSAGDGHTVQHSGGGEITCDNVVLCAGPWSSTAAKELLGVDVHVKELAGHSVVLRPKQPLPALAIFASVVDAENMSTETPELFSRPDGTIYVAGENCEWTKGCFALLSSLSLGLQQEHLCPSEQRWCKRATHRWPAYSLLASSFPPCSTPARQKWSRKRCATGQSLRGATHTCASCRDGRDSF